MNIWNRLTTSEKVWIGVILIFIIAIFLRWENIWNEIKKGFEPYFNKKY